MASGSEYFNRCGPKYLSNIDWNNAHHRRSVSASLVEGVYMLEEDRQARRGGSQCVAPPWWEFFSFKVVNALVDDNDKSIFGAIFEYKPSAYSYHLSMDRSPRYVIAFRGTLFKLESFARDLKLDIDIIRNGLHHTGHFRTAIKAVLDLVSVVGSSKVWLTGHSLGAAMAMLAKKMAKRGNFLEAFLFNPPYVSPPIERIKIKKVRHGLRFAGTLMALHLHLLQHRKKVEDIGAGGLARLTSQHSLGNMAMSAVGIKGIDTSEPLHLLPSTNLTVNLYPCQDMIFAC
ncbi:hypothetical protein Goklo_024281 [Gossypium klotzschianum]|uniref:Fungal lipase-type domain-containing protein n=1 Tax=Gossypium klotzschianum TaxID=34286 RepID=A0A7J8W931_9ROSI|nr:hypothetical protein [Gossypium klotzschianum]